MLTGTIIPILAWSLYIAVFFLLARKGRGHDATAAGKIPFTVQAFAYVATYISAVALVGFGGLAHAYGLQMLLVAAGNVWLGTWAVYRFLAWPTREWQRTLGARSPAQLLGLGHESPLLGRALAFIFAIFLGVYASAVIKGAALLLAEVLPLPLWSLVWLVACAVGLCVMIGGLRGVLYTEAMQGVVMLCGIVLIVGAVIVKVGGPFRGVVELAALEPNALANNGFAAVSSGDVGLFIISLVAVTSVAVWAQPQVIQRHFAIGSRSQLSGTACMAMLVLTLLVGGTYFAAALSRLILPGTVHPDAVMPQLVSMLLPEAGMHVFVLAVVSASLSTASALYHIAALAIAEDVPGKTASRPAWLAGVSLCVVISALCALGSGQLIAMLCTTSWSMVGATALVPYVALVRFGRRSASAAWCASVSGFAVCLFWYLCVYEPTALITPLIAPLKGLPPFFVGLTCSICGWGAGLLLPRPSAVAAAGE